VVLFLIDLKGCLKAFEDVGKRRLHMDTLISDLWFSNNEGIRDISDSQILKSYNLISKLKGCLTLGRLRHLLMMK
jgi:hypothetical protein